MNWVCYFSDANSKIHNIREVATLGSNAQIAPPDADGEVIILMTDALGVKMADGVTDVAGDHHKDNVPPSENDYCIGLLIRFGDFTYVTAGDLDGEYATSGWGYTYNGKGSRPYCKAGAFVFFGEGGRQFLLCPLTMASVGRVKTE